MKNLKWLAILLIAALGCISAHAQTYSNPVAASLTVQDSGACSTQFSFLWQHLPANAGTTTVNLSGTFSATVTIRESNNGGQTWSNAGTVSAVGTTTYSTNGFTDFCVDTTTYASGTVVVSISTGLQQVQSTVTVQSSSSNAIPNNTYVQFNPLSYGALADVQRAFSCTNTSSTVTCGAADPPFSCPGGVYPCSAAAAGSQLATGGSSVGKIFQFTSVATPCQTTISSVTSAHVAVTAASCGTISVSNSAQWGTDDTTAIETADTAAKLICGTLQLPSGVMFMQNATGLNTAPTFCQTGVGTGRTSETVIGYGPLATMIIPTVNFNYNTTSSCNGKITNGVSGCFWSFTNVALNGFSIYGGSINTAGTRNVALINTGGAGLNSAVTNVQLLYWMPSADSSTVGLILDGTATQAFNIEVDGAGYLNFLSNGQVQMGGPICFFGDSVTGVQVLSGTLWMQMCGVGGNGTSFAANNQMVVNSGSTLKSFFTGYSVFSGATANNVECLGTCYHDHDTFSNAGTSSSVEYVVGLSSAVNAYFIDSVFTAPTNGRLFQVGTNSAFNERGGNIMNEGPVASVYNNGNGNQFIPNKSVAGACTGTVSASITGGLYYTGSNITSSVCATIGATIGAGTPMDHAGNMHYFTVNAGTGGVNASSGVFTVLKNGVATTITCTLGTSTQCIDVTHVVAFAYGDLISIQYTTQAADTLANIKANVDTGF